MFIYYFSCTVEEINQGYCMVVVGNSFIKMENKKNGTIILHAEDNTQHVLRRGVSTNKYLPFYSIFYVSSYSTVVKGEGLCLYFARAVSTLLGVGAESG
jgi:hypothetical protein